MSDTRLRISQLSSASVSSDGMFRFLIVFEKGKPMPVEIRLSDVAMLASYLLTGASRASEKLGIEAKEINEAEVPIEAIPLRGIGILTAPSGQDGCHLVLRLPGFWMSFAMESKQMAEFAARMSSIALLSEPQGRA